MVHQEMDLGMDLVALIVHRSVEAENVSSYCKYFNRGLLNVFLLIYQTCLELLFDPLFKIIQIFPLYSSGPKCSGTVNELTDSSNIV